LVLLFEKIPFARLRTCIVCGKYFTATRRKKVPACKGCLQRLSLEKWRKEHRAEYNLYQAWLRKGIISDLQKDGRIMDKVRIELMKSLSK